MRGLRVVQTAPNSQSQSAVAQTSMEPPLAQAAAPDAGRKPGIERLRLLVADDMAATNREILHRMDSDVRLIPELASHLIPAGGKRIRPMLTLACARLCGHQGANAELPAARLEFIHTATPLH